MNRSAPPLAASRNRTITLNDTLTSPALYHQSVLTTESTMKAVIMQDETRKKSDGGNRHQVNIPEDDQCEPNTGKPKQDKTKPDCPEGYPDEQPKDDG